MDTEVVVIGGGPAGSATAALLASWGHDVMLVTRPTPPGGWLAESIPTSARKLFERVGMLEALDRAELFPNGGNTVWWADGGERREPFPGGLEGVHAERAALERTMLSAASATGVRVSHAGPVRRAGRTGDGWRVEWGDSRVEARAVVDASGRAGVLARTERVEDPGTATLALVGRWRSEGGWGEDETHTLIESYRDGWAWSVPISHEIRSVTAMVDPRRTELDRQGDLEAMLLTEIGKTRHLRGRLASAVREGAARACPASLYGARRHAWEGVVLVGDAGSCIDPLSSYGVKKALASAWLAAVTVHTGLTDIAMAPTAAAFFDAREREVYRRYRALSVPFFEQAARAHEHAFWTARIEAARAAGGVERSAADATSTDPSDILNPAMDADDLVRRRRVREAYAEIRRCPRVEFHRAPAARTVESPLIVGRRVVLAPHLISPAVAEPVRYVRNVDLCRLVEEAPRHTQVPDLYEAYNASASPVQLPDFLAALATAVGVGFLEVPGWRSSPEGRTI